MNPLEGPGLALIAPHLRYEAEPAVAPKQVDPSGGALFESVLKNVAGDANTAIQQADSAGQEFAAGTRDDIHGTMLALSKADIELRLVSNIRSKVVDAFYELWRMQI
jgi:flagellar hook-basal body complex protein FliE